VSYDFYNLVCIIGIALFSAYILAIKNIAHILIIYDHILASNMCESSCTTQLCCFAKYVNFC